MAWMIGAFVFCPCHLPITLAALALLLGGTAAGAALRAHPYIAAVVVTLLWAAGTWRGYQLIRRARVCRLDRLKPQYRRRLPISIVDDEIDEAVEALAEVADASQAVASSSRFVKPRFGSCVSRTTCSPTMPPTKKLPRHCGNLSPV